jgi:hypothetical protein
MGVFISVCDTKPVLSALAWRVYPSHTHTLLCCIGLTGKLLVVSSLIAFTVRGFKIVAGDDDKGRRKY